MNLNVCSIIIFAIVNVSLKFSQGYEVYRLPITPRRTLEFWSEGITLLPPLINGYGGPQGFRADFKCRARTEGAVDIMWYKQIVHEENCRHQVLRTNDGIFCSVNARTTRLYHRRRRYIRNLIFQRPRVADSGMYICVVSREDFNVTLPTKIIFHETHITPVRVVNALNQNYGEGLVQIFVNGQWSTIDFYGFESPEANIICRILGFPFGGEPRYPFSIHNNNDRPFFYDRKSRRMPIYNLDCPFNASDVTDCRGLDAVLQNKEIMGITCRREPTTIPDNILRLAGTSQTEGRLEIFHNGLWGTICSKGVTSLEVNALCTSLGYNYGGTYYNAWDTFYFTTLGVGPIMISGLRCPKSASGFNGCTYNQIGNLCCNCSHADDLAVRCYTRPDESSDGSEGSLRLAAFGRDDRGRVEIFYGGSWGTVDAYWLQEPEANMFCIMLGYPYGGEPMDPALVPAGQGIYWIRYIACPLKATHISNCSVTWNNDAAIRNQVAGGGVICRHAPVSVPAVPFRVGRNAQGIERLQYFKDDYWGTVCGAYMGTPEASMICSMMGYSQGGRLLRNTRDWSFKGLGPILLKYMDCPLGVTNISHCYERNYTRYDSRFSCYSYSDHRQDIQLSCNDQPFQDMDVRLNGPSPNNGLVEIYKDGNWTTVELYPFDPRVAAVICRQLGYDYGGEMELSYNCIYQERCRQFVSVYADCTGKEENLGHCNKIEWTSWYYSRRPTSIHCYRRNESNFNVSIDENAQEGVILMSKNDENYYICAKLWDEIHAKAACQQLGFRDGVPKYYLPDRWRQFQYAKMVNIMYCDRGSTNLGQCYHTGWGHYGDDCFSERAIRAGVKCFNNV